MPNSPCNRRVFCNISVCALGHGPNLVNVWGKDPPSVLFISQRYLRHFALINYLRTAIKFFV